MNLANTLRSELTRLEATDSHQLIGQVKLVIQSFFKTNTALVGTLTLAVGIIKEDKYRLFSTNDQFKGIIPQVESLLKDGIDNYITLTIKNNKAQLFIQDQNYDTEIEFYNGKEKILLFHDYSLQNETKKELTPELIKKARLEIIAEIKNPKKQIAA